MGAKSFPSHLVTAEVRTGTNFSDFLDKPGADGKTPTELSASRTLEGEMLAQITDNNATMPDRDARPANPFWLNAVQTLAFCNMLVIFVPWCAALLSPNDRQRYVGLLLFLTPFSIPFIWAFWKLSAWPDARTVKRAIAVTASGAFLVLIPSLLLAWESASDRYSWRITANSAIISIIQAALIHASIKTNFSMERDHSDVRILMPPLGAALLILTCLMALFIRLNRVHAP